MKCDRVLGRGGFLYLLVFLLLSLWIPATYAATYSGGSGIEGDPYLISTVQDLLDLSNPANSADRDKYFLMTNNIDMSGNTTFIPINFEGGVDGGGYAIQNLTTNSSLFMQIGETCHIKNLGMLGGSVTGNGIVGGLVGENYGGKISACYSTGAVTGGDGANIGGLVGRNCGGTINACYSTGAVTGGDEATIGGLVGENYGGTINACYSTGAVTGGDGATIGGLVGSETWTRTILSVCASFWDIETTGQAGSSGGKGLSSAQMTQVSIFQNAGWSAHGWVMTAGQYPRLAWESTVAPPIPAAEPIHLAGGGTAGDPYRVGTPEQFALLSQHVSLLDKHILLTQNLDCSGVTLSPIGDLGPFSGVFDGNGKTVANVDLDYPGSDFVGVFARVLGNIKNTGIVNAQVTGRKFCGGLIGYNSGMVQKCFTELSATVSGYSGGLIGKNTGAVVDSHSAGVLNAATGITQVLGGLVGYNTLKGYNYNCYSSCIINSHDDFAGGLVGWSGTGCIISGCYATGDISGHNVVGGLVAYNDGATVMNSFAIGLVSGDATVGGLIGWNLSTDARLADVINCYSTGKVAGTLNVGGLIANKQDLSGSHGAVVASFWDINIGGPDNGIGTGLTTAQMKQRSAFESAGWDFSGSPPVWFITEGKTYPKLFGIPMPIDTIDALQTLSDSPNGSYFLTQDLDARTSSEWADKENNPGFLPIGTALNPFNGTLDGRAHRIYGLHIYRPALDNVGLFGYLGSSGVVKGVGLEESTITGHNQTGGIAGLSQGTIEQCYVRGNIIGTNNTGGLIGENHGTVKESYAAATLSGISPGGLIGINIGGSVITSFWDTVVSGISYSGGGVGLSTALMHQNLTYISAGWDFSTLWSIADGFSYPYFQNSIPLRVVTAPPCLINSGFLDIDVETFVPNLFVTIGGGAYPVFSKESVAGLVSISVPLKQEAVNKLIISAISEAGVETVAGRYDVFESDQFPSAPTEVTTLTLTPDSLSLSENASQEYFCSAAFADGTTGDITPTASWNVTGGSITTAGLYTHSTGTGTVQALLHTEQGWLCSNTATITTAKSAPAPKAGTGQVTGVVRSHYTGLGLPAAQVTVYTLLNPSVAAQHAVYDALGNYSFLMNEGKYHFEGSCAEHRSEIIWGGQLRESPELLTPGPPEQWSAPYYWGQVMANRPLSHDFSLRPNDSGAPWVVFIEPVANTTVNTDHIVVTAIDADQYSELAMAKYSHNTIEYDIPDKISSTGFYRDTWTLELGINVLHLYTMDTESNASEKTIEITYDPNYTVPGWDSDGDGMPNSWERDHGLDPFSASGVNGADGDLDGDSLMNLEEYKRGTLPNSTRSDSDSLADGFEVTLGTNPLEADTDGDGVNDDVEWQRGSNPLHDDRIKMAIVNLSDGASIRGDAVTLLADVVEGYTLGLVASVSFEVRGTSTGGAWRLISTATTAPFSVTWDTTPFPAGAYQLRAVASSKLGCVDATPQPIVVNLSPSAPYFERIEAGTHLLSAPVPLVSQTTLALREGARFAKITIPAGALATADTLTAFFPDASSFTPSFSTMQQDADLYLDVTLVSHTGVFLNGKRATIDLSYPDTDLDDHLDDTGLRVPFLSLQYLPAPTAAFIPLVSSTVDRATNCVRGETTHFSTFGIIEEQPASPLNLLTGSLPQGVVGTPYTAPLDANGGAAPYAWTVTSGALPSGINITGNTLSGTPTAAGSFPITLQVADAQSIPSTASRAFTVEIFAANQPTVIIARQSGQPGIDNALSAFWTITFSEPVTGFATEDVTLTGTASPGAVFAVSGTGAVYTLEVTSLTRDGTLHPTVPSGKASSIATSALNRASTNEEEIWVDRKKPQVQITSSCAGLLDYGASGPIIVKSLPVQFILAFDESVTGFTTSDITFEGLDPQPEFGVYGLGKNYTLLITNATAGSTLTPTILADAAADSATNTNAATTYSGREVHYVPETRVTVTINQRSTQADPARIFPIYYDIVFSAPVTGFETNDVVYSGTATNPLYAISGSGATYTLTVTNASSDGRLAFYIPEDVTVEGNAASTSTDNVVNYDATPPALTIGLPSASKTRQGPVSFAIQYTGVTAVTLSPADILLNGTPTAAVSVTGAGLQTRIVTLTGISGIGTLGISIKQGTASDAAGNFALAAGPSATVDVDPRLTVTIDQAPGQRDPNNRLPLYFDVEFIEEVTGFEQDDIIFDGSASGVDYEITGSGAIYSLKITSVANPGTIIPHIEAGVCQGVWGGMNVASTSTDNSIYYDPTLALAMFTAEPTEGHIPMTVQFTDQSILGTLPIDAWDWDFGDDTFSEEQNPEHVYETIGDYTVSLTVTTATGSNTWTIENYIHVEAAMPLLSWLGMVFTSALLCMGGFKGIQQHSKRKNKAR